MLGLVIVLFSLFRSEDVTIAVDNTATYSGTDVCNNNNQCKTIKDAVEKQVTLTGDQKEIISVSAAETIGTKVVIEKSATIEGDPTTTTPVLTTAITAFEIKGVTTGDIAVVLKKVVITVKADDDISVPIISTANNAQVTEAQGQTPGTGHASLELDTVKFTATIASGKSITGALVSAASGTLSLKAVSFEMTVSGNALTSSVAALTSVGVFTMSLTQKADDKSVIGVVFAGDSTSKTPITGDVILTNGITDVSLTLKDVTIEASSGNTISAEGTIAITLNGVDIVAPSTVANTVTSPIISTTTTPLILIDVGYMKIVESSLSNDPVATYSKISGITITPPTDASSDPTFTVKFNKRFK